ncbi:Nucleoid occlusion protein [subsurface metagenome]|jgi:ParB/RepB/Spo0J family partition protein
MAYDYKVLEIKRVPLINLVIGKGQVRKHNVSKEINELTDSIRVIGQLHPIVVCESADQPGKLEILTGQRRFLACKELGQDDIWAMILDRPVPDVEAKVISFSENLVKRDPDKADYIDLCNHFYNIYGDFKIIAEKTGLTPAKVRKYVKYASLSPELKEMVDKGSGSGSIDMRTALRIQTALEKTGEVKPDVAVALANKMRSMISPHKDRVVKEAEIGGVTTIEEVDEVTEAVKKGKTYVELRVKIDQDTNKALSKYALSEGMKREDAAQSLITDALESMGHLEGEE